MIILLVLLLLVMLLLSSLFRLSFMNSVLIPLKDSNTVAQLVITSLKLFFISLAFDAKEVLAYEIVFCKKCLFVVWPLVNVADSLV